jgi:hypothetical protein
VRAKYSRSDIKQYNTNISEDGTQGELDGDGRTKQSSSFAETGSRI